MALARRAHLALAGRAFLAALLWHALPPPAAWSQQIEWIRQFGSANFDQALGVALGDSGVYVAGQTEGALPGQTRTGSFDAFVRKYDAAGNAL